MASFDLKMIWSLCVMFLRKCRSHLQQFVCALNCICISVSHIVRLATSLHHFLEKSYTTAPKRNCCGVASLERAKLVWTTLEQRAVHNYKWAVLVEVTLAHPAPLTLLSAYNNSIEDWFSSIRTKVLASDSNLLHGKWRHSLLVFLPAVHCYKTSLKCAGNKGSLLYPRLSDYTGWQLSRLGLMFYGS